MSGIALTLIGFSGMVPRKGAQVLGDSESQLAVNCLLTSGQLVPMTEALLENDPGVTGIRSIFRMRSTAGAAIWLAWDVLVSAAKGPVAGDTTYRTYYTGDGEPRVTDNSLAISGTPYPYAFYVLGVHPPVTAPTVSHDAGGTGAAVTRTFWYTYVTEWGEESAPSPLSTAVTGKLSGSWTVSGMDVAPPNTFTVSGGSWGAGVATLNLNSKFGLRVGEQVNITGVTPSGYNGTKVTITEVGTTYIKYALASNPGTYTSGGSVARVAPHHTSNMKKRVYWSETTAVGTRMQAPGPTGVEIAVATTSTNISGSLSSGEECETEFWEMPPATLQNIISLSNGAMAGSVKNELWLSVAGVPYAWIKSYQVDYDIVGLGAFGNSIVVATTGKPYLATGSDPEAMEVIGIDQPWPCVTKESITPVAGGVAYACPFGLVVIGPNGAGLYTQDLYTKEEWKLLSPETFRAGTYGGKYVASYVTEAGPRQLLVIDKSEFSALVTANDSVDCIWAEPEGELYIVSNDTIYKWQADVGRRKIADWVSKEFSFPHETNLGAGQVEAIFNMSAEESAAALANYNAVVAANNALLALLGIDSDLNTKAMNMETLNGSKLAPVPSLQWESLTLELYVNGVLRSSKQITDDRPFKLKGGYKGSNATVRLSGNVAVKRVALAETMLGLRKG